jgi:hypothetical protein
LFEHKIPHNKKTFVAVAKHGQFEVIQWFFENKFQYDEDVFKYVAENGNLKIMQWLLKNKFSYNKETIFYAILNGNLKNIIWLLDNKFPQDKCILSVRIKRKVYKLLNNYLEKDFRSRFNIFVHTQKYTKKE